MAIEKNLNGTGLIVKVAGRVDTPTAPELETTLKEGFSGVTKLVLDCSVLSTFLPLACV